MEQEKKKLWWKSFFIPFIHSTSMYIFFCMELSDELPFNLKHLTCHKIYYQSRIMVQYVRLFNQEKYFLIHHHDDTKWEQFLFINSTLEMCPMMLYNKTRLNRRA